MEAQRVHTGKSTPRFLYWSKCRISTINCTLFTWLKYGSSKALPLPETGESILWITAWGLTKKNIIRLWYWELYSVKSCRRPNLFLYRIEAWLLRGGMEICTTTYELYSHLSKFQTILLLNQIVSDDELKPSISKRIWLDYSSRTRFRPNYWQHYRD